jgi:metal-responsive CopG/Arc/MetJ family transcriptional regulator
MRLSDELIEKVDAWAETHGVGRSEAIRQLVEFDWRQKSRRLLLIHKLFRHQPKLHPQARTR